MPNVVGRTLLIEYGDAETYLTASNCSLDVKVLGVEMAVRKYLQSQNGYATLNSTAMDILYPNSTAHPIKMDSEYRAGLLSSSSAPYIETQFNGTTVLKHTVETTTPGETFADSNIVATAISNSTKSSTLRFHLYCARTQALAMNNISLTLYFNQYACSANTAGNGVESASVSDATPWDGDSVTFTATLKSGATWHGWYSDAACTQLVSTAQTYTTNAADLTLYAYATKDTTGTGIYLKQNGAYKEAQAAYKKVNGVWV